MRLTGMMSGMDTESIIQQLVEAKKTKVDKTKKSQTKLNWKQDAWKELNTKLQNLQKKYLSNMRFATDYAKKTTKVSNSNKVSVITGESAVNGVQSLKIESLAKSGIMTGGKLEGAEGELTALSKISDIKGVGDINGTINIATKDGKSSVDIEINGETTISDVLTQLKSAGVNASFDAKQQRLYISSKEMGEANDFTITGDDAALSALGLNMSDSGDKKATKVEGQDAVIYLNDARYTSTNNTFEINGLTFTALGTTDKDEEITVTTQNDTDGVYDMLKNFLKEYNSIINEMDKLYNADSAKGYEPLTNDEKEAMSESDIKEWETKIKDSLLRRDENISTVSSALKSVMSAGIEINGKTMYLSSFGINTLSYFEAADNERNAYHIDGDPDDASTSGNADKLKSMIASDPDTVISFFTQLSKNLYDKMSDLSQSVDGYRTYGNFYDDKKMKSDYDDYTSKISDLEKKLADYEDKWYKKFAAMETALAKMQSNMSAVTGLLGG
ncbi:MAG: flagellar filament capping protein FliD [Lachnospiraceae bacterium]|nr:flagellar filament capping protein FliD [Lachnospiraceae bacterium]